MPPEPPTPVRREADRLWRCDFCGMPQSKAERLFQERGAVICADCVELCHEWLLEGRAEKKAAKKGTRTLHAV